MSTAFEAACATRIDAIGKKAANTAVSESGLRALLESKQLDPVATKAVLRNFYSSIADPALLPHPAELIISPPHLERVRATVSAALLAAYTDVYAAIQTCGLDVADVAPHTPDAVGTMLA